MNGYAQWVRNSADRDVGDLPCTCEKLHCDAHVEYGVLFSRPAEWVAYCEDCFESLKSSSSPPNAVVHESL